MTEDEILKLNQEADDATNGKVPCPKCGQPVNEMNRRCPHCGVNFSVPAYQFGEDERGGGGASAGIRLVAIAMLGLLVLGTVLSLVAWLM